MIRVIVMLMGRLSIILSASRKGGQKVTTVARVRRTWHTYQTCLIHPYENISREYEGNKNGTEAFPCLKGPHRGRTLPILASAIVVSHSTANDAALEPNHMARLRSNTNHPQGCLYRQYRVHIRFFISFPLVMH